MDKEKNARLEQLYKNKSRHSQYQILASNVEPLVRYQKPIKSKHEKERWDYIVKNVDVEGMKVLDIGGNTGFFTFESCNNRNPKSVDYYEGNREHAEFVELASSILGLADIIRVHPEYFLFGEQKEVFDVVYFLNVIHHIGFDFEKYVTIDMVKNKMLDHINEMAKYSRRMAFQMGFNWYGDIDRCLFEHGTKKEVEEYIISGTKDYWNVEKIGVVEKIGDNFVYKDMNERNNERVDSFGEFLNRPLFIMKSRVV